VEHVPFGTRVPSKRCAEEKLHDLRKLDVKLALVRVRRSREITKAQFGFSQNVQPDMERNNIIKFVDLLSQNKDGLAWNCIVSE